MTEEAAQAGVGDGNGVVPREPAHVLALAFGIVNLVALPFGGLSLDIAIFYSLLLVLIAVGVLVYFGRRRQKAAQAKRAEQIAARTR